jgi:hypothetical protein
MAPNFQIIKEKYSNCHFLQYVQIGSQEYRKNLF